MKSRDSEIEVDWRQHWLKSAESTISYYKIFGQMENKALK